MLIGYKAKNFECSHLILNFVHNMYFIISANNANGTLTGTHLTYKTVHTHKIMPTSS